MEKIEYKINQLKKTNGKKYENYCISRIMTKLDSYDLQFITQQLFKKSNNEIALADLYIPQINMWVEIDESQHLKQTEEDKKRTLDILKNDIKKKFNDVEEVKYENLEKPIRINIFKQDGSFNNSLDKDIDQYVVSEAISRINNKCITPWNAVYNSPDYYKREKSIKTEDNARFKTIQDISTLFNKNYKKMRRNYFKIDEVNNIYCWCPKVALDSNEFSNIPYNNIIKDNGKYIIEISTNNNDDFVNKILDSNEKRYTFCYYKDECLNYMYKFRGVYELDKIKTKKNKKRYWVRKDTKIDLTPYI